MKELKNYPLYPIGIVSELLDVHPETIRTWEKAGVVQPPQRRSGKRFYSERDFKQLQFIQRLAKEGLTLRAILYYLRIYPCWKTADCTGCLHASQKISSTKECWQEANTYCRVADNQDPCAGCECSHEEPAEIAAPEPDTDTMPVLDESRKQQRVL